MKSDLRILPASMCSKSFSKDIIYYGFGNMLYTLVQLVCMPIIIRAMSMSEVAAWNILLPTGVLLSAIVTFGIDSAVARFIVHKDYEVKRNVFSTGIYFLVGFASMVSIILWVQSSYALNVINLPVEHLDSYIILLFWLPGIIISQFFQSWFKYTFQRYRFILIITLQSTIYLLAIIYLEISNKIGLHNIMLASIISIWTPVIFGYYYTHKMFVLKLDIQLLFRLLMYGGPFMVLAFGFNLIFSVDKYILSASTTQEEFAIYAQAFRVAAIFSMVISTFNFAFGPYALSMLYDKHAPEVLGGIRTFYLLYIGFLGLCFIAVSKVVILTFSGPEYIGGYKYIPLFVLAYILYGLFSFSQLGIIYSKKSYLGFYVLSSGLLITLSLDYLLVHEFHGYGTAIGASTGLLVMVMAASYISINYLRILINGTKDSVLIIAYIASGWLISSILTIDNIYIESLVKLAVVIAVFSGVYFSPFFRVERSKSYRLFSGVLAR